MFALTAKQTNWTMQAAAVATILVALFTWHTITWNGTVILMAVSMGLALLAFFHALIHYINEIYGKGEHTMSKTYTIGVEFIETDPRAGKEPHLVRQTWSGPAESEKDAIKRCCDWFGFEEDGIEVTDIRVLGDEPPEDEEA